MATKSKATRLHSPEGIACFTQVFVPKARTDKAGNAKGAARETGFVLLVFPFGNAKDGDRCLARGQVERIGSARVQAASWRLAFFATALVAIVLGVALVVVLRQSRVVPYIVEVGASGAVVGVAPAPMAMPISVLITKPAMAVASQSAAQNSRRGKSRPVSAMRTARAAY